jgi:hypothetical protein
MSGAPSPGQQAPIHTGGLQPMQMLQALRAGQQMVNPTFQRPPQYLPKGLEDWVPTPVAPRVGVLGSPENPWRPGDPIGQGLNMNYAGPGDATSGDGAAGGVGGVAGGDGGGGGGGAK